MGRIFAAALIIVMVTLLPAGVSRALAHGGEPVTPSTMWQSWNTDPLIILPLALITLLYGRGYRLSGKRSEHRRGTRRWQAAAFAGSIAALLVALISPLYALSQALFAAHMAQHLLLIVVAAPLLVLSAPAVPLRRALPRSGRVYLAQIYRVQPLRVAMNILAHPAAAWALHAAALYFWHVPVLFEAAAQYEWLHGTEHMSFLATGVLYWWSILSSHGSKVGAYSIGMLSLFAMMMQCSLLGALITFSSIAWYPTYNISTQAWGLSPLEDQQLAGLVMWIPAGAVYMSAAIALGGMWFSAVEQRTILRANLKLKQRRPEL